MKSHRRQIGLNLVAICLASAILSGCGPPSIFHKFSTSGNEHTSVLVDANQRAIIAAPGPNSTVDGSAQRSVIVCAEPSPDTLSAVSGLLNLSSGKGVFDSGPDEATALALFEAVTEQLGPRNATIQLLRDGLYRQCEAYLNGVLSSEDYETLANRYVDGMVTLLAIERITPNPNERSDYVDETQSEKIRSILENMNSVQGEPPLEELTVGSEKDSSNNDRRAARGETQQMSRKEARSEPEYVIEAVSKLTNAFLKKNLLDKCIKEHVEGEGDENGQTSQRGDTEALQAAVSWMEEYDRKLAQLSEQYISKMEQTADTFSRSVYKDMIEHNDRLRRRNFYTVSEAMENVSGVRPEYRISNRLCGYLMRTLYLDEREQASAELKDY